MMCLKVKEGEYPTTVPMDVGRDTKGFLHAAKTYFQECFGHSYYRWYFIAVGLSWQAFVPTNLFNVFYATDLHIDPDVYGKCITLTYFFSLVLSYPLGVLVDRFHPLRVSMVALILYAVVALWGGLFIHDTFTFSLTLVAHGVISGAWFTSIASIGQRLLPKAEFAQFYSAAGIIQSVCAILVGLAVGLLLDHVVHHNYRYTYYMGFGISVVALLCNLVLHRKFVALGGPKNYVAPEFAHPKAL
jgi:MFS family permease